MPECTAHLARLVCFFIVLVVGMLAVYNVSLELLGITAWAIIPPLIFCVIAGMTFANPF